jgi:gliding motility-associated-like protein
MPILCEAQLIAPYWTVDPPQYSWPKVYCKGDCVQFIDSSIIINTTNPIFADDTLITKWFWFFTGRSNKQILYNTSLYGFPQPLFPYATDTIVLFKKQNPPPLCYDTVGLFDIAFSVQYSTGFIPGVPLNIGSIKIIDAPIYTDADQQHIELRFGDEHVLTACARDKRYRWFPANETGCDTCDTYVIKPFTNTTYTCIITNENGCSKTCRYKVELENAPKAFYVPNSFTPNSDGINDIFKPISLNQKMILFSIYNRWGQKIFETQDENVGWNGTSKYLNAEEGVYTYSILYTGSTDDVSKALYGSVMLIR